MHRNNGMRFALFVGCTIAGRVKQYELSARAVLGRLGVELVDVPEFNCCGYPVENSDFELFALFSARNLALAEKRGLKLMTLCQCCFGSLKKVHHLMQEDVPLRNRINAYLAKDDLSYGAGVEVTHLLSVLHRDVGPAALGEHIRRPLEGLKIATHYGCHALRPSDIVQFDNAVEPVLFDRLVEATGAESIAWPLKLECCGAPLIGINDELSMDLMERKLDSGKEAGADFLCVGCPWCQAQFDGGQERMRAVRGGHHNMGSILYPQLLGLAMGVDGRELGLHMNKLNLGAIEGFLA